MVKKMNSKIKLVKTTLVLMTFILSSFSGITATLVMNLNNNSIKGGKNSSISSSNTNQSNVVQFGGLHDFSYWQAYALSQYNKSGAFVNITASEQGILYNISMTYYNRERGVYANTRVYNIDYWMHWMWNNPYQLFNPSNMSFGSFWAALSSKFQKQFLNVSRVYLELMSLQLTFDEANIQFNGMFHSAEITNIVVDSWTDKSMNLRVSVNLDYFITRLKGIYVQVYAGSGSDFFNNLIYPGGVLWLGDLFTKVAAYSLVTDTYGHHYNIPPFDYNNNYAYTSFYSGNYKGSGFFPFYASNNPSDYPIQISSTDINPYFVYSSSKTYYVKAVLDYSELWIGATRPGDNNYAINLPMTNVDTAAPVIKSLEAKSSSSSTWFPIGGNGYFNSPIPIFSGQDLNVNYIVGDDWGIDNLGNSYVSAAFSTTGGWPPPLGTSISKTYSVTVTPANDGYNDWNVMCTIPYNDISSTHSTDVYIQLHARDANNNFPNHPVDQNGNPVIYVDWKEITGSANTQSNLDHLGKVFSNVGLQTFSYIFDTAWQAGDTDRGTDHPYPGEHVGYSLVVVNPTVNSLAINDVDYSIMPPATGGGPPNSPSSSDTSSNHGYDSELIPSSSQNLIGSQTTGYITIQPFAPQITQTGTIYLLIRIDYTVAGVSGVSQDVRSITIQYPESPAMYIQVNTAWEAVSNLNAVFNLMYRDVTAQDKGLGKVEVDIKVHNYARCPLVFEPLSILPTNTKGLDNGAKKIDIFESDTNGNAETTSTEIPQIFYSTAGIASAHQNTTGKFFIERTDAKVLPSPDFVLDAITQGAWANLFGNLVTILKAFSFTPAVSVAGGVAGVFDVITGLADGAIAYETIVNANLLNLYTLTFGITQKWGYNVAPGATSPAISPLDFDLGNSYKVNVMATCTPTQNNEINTWEGAKIAATIAYITAGALLIAAALSGASGAVALFCAMVSAATFAFAKLMDYIAFSQFHYANSIDPPVDYTIRESRDYPKFNYPYGSTGNITIDRKLNATYQATQKLAYDKSAINITTMKINAAAVAGSLYWKTIQEQDYLFFIQRKETESSQNETAGALLVGESSQDAYRALNFTDQDINNSVTQYAHNGGPTLAQNQTLNQFGLANSTIQESVNQSKMWVTNKNQYNYTTITGMMDTFSNTSLVCDVRSTQEEQSASEGFVSDILNYRGATTGSLSSSDRATLDVVKNEIDNLLYTGNYTGAILESKRLINTVINIQLQDNILQNDELKVFLDYAFNSMNTAYQNANKFRSAGIVIDGNAELAEWSIRGNGTIINPYLISNLYVAPVDHRTCLIIQNTTKYFELTGCAFNNQLNLLEILGPITGDCVYLKNVTHATIDDNTIFGSPGTGIFVFPSSSDVLILSNSIFGYKFGAIVEGGSNCIIQDNWIYNRFAVDSPAIWLEGVRNVDLFGNTLFFCSITISGDNIANFNTVSIDSSNRINYHSVLYLVQKTSSQVQAAITSINGPIGQLGLVQCNDTTLKRLSIDTMSTGFGVAFVYCVNDVINDTLFSGLGSGIAISNSTGCVAGNNIFRYTGIPIIVGGGSGNAIKNNIVTESDNGIWLVSTKQNQILRNSISILRAGGDTGIYVTSGSTHNFIIGNAINSSLPTNRLDENYGIRIEGVSSNNYTANIISNLYFGLYALSSSNNGISSNTITNNYYGLYLVDAKKSYVLGNTISFNYYGLELLGASDWLIANEFMNNSIVNVETTVKFYSSNLGNYWGDYMQKCPNAHVNNWTVPYQYIAWNTPYPICQLYNGTWLMDISPLVLLKTSAPITLNGNAAVDAFFASQKGQGRDGTSFAKAYILEAKDITAPKNGVGITIQSVNRFINIVYCKIESINGVPPNDGISLSSSSNIRILDCIVTNSTTGVDMESCNTIGMFYSIVEDTVISTGNGVTINTCTLVINIASNLIYGFNCGVYACISTNALAKIFALLFCYYSVTGNTITDCNTGTYLDPNIPITVEGNWIYYTGTAIQLVNGTGEAIIDNVLFANQFGITLSNSANTTIRSNIIADSAGYGIFIANQSKTNIMANNTFIGNKAGGTQASDDAPSDMWYNNSWSDFRDRYPFASNNGTTWSSGYQIDGGAGVIDSSPRIYQTLTPKTELIISLGNELSALSSLIANISIPALRNTCQSYMTQAMTYYYAVLDSQNAGTPFNATIVHELDQQITNIANTAEVNAISSKSTTIHTMIQDMLYIEIGPFLRSMDDISWSLNDVGVLIGQLPNGSRKDYSSGLLRLAQLFLSGVSNKYMTTGNVSLSELSLLELSVRCIAKVADNRQITSSCIITIGFIEQLENLTTSMAEGVVAGLSSTISKLERDINLSCMGKGKTTCLNFAEQLERTLHNVGKDLARYQYIDPCNIFKLTITVMKIETKTRVSLITADCTEIQALINQLSFYY